MVILSRHVLLLCLLVLFIQPATAQQTDAEKLFEFENHLQSVYLDQNGVAYDTLNPKAKAIMLGYAMGRQLKLIKEDDELLNFYNQMDSIIKQNLEDLAWAMGNNSEERRTAWQQLMQLYAASAAGYVDDDIATHYTLPEKVPIAFSKNTGKTGTIDQDIVGWWKAEGGAASFYRDLHLTNRETAAGYEVSASSRGFKVPAFTDYSMRDGVMTLTSSTTGQYAELQRIDINTWKGPVYLSDGSPYVVANDEQMILTLSRVYIGDQRQ